MTSTTTADEVLNAGLAASDNPQRGMAVWRVVRADRDRVARPPGVAVAHPALTRGSIATQDVTVLLCRGDGDYRTVTSCVGTCAYP